MIKQEQIEEIKQVLIKTCKRCRPIEEDYMQSKYAEALYNAGYRKIPKDTLVLLIGKDNQPLDEETIEYFVNHNQEIRNETSKEILDDIFAPYNDIGGGLYELTPKDKKMLYKKYGVDLGE